ncbi:hypothetical protein OXX80_002376 [Metschnikowia pulcherrima]
MHSDQQHFHGGGGEPPGLVGQGHRPPQPDENREINHDSASQDIANSTGVDESGPDAVAELSPRPRSWAEILSQSISSAQRVYGGANNSEEIDMESDDSYNRQSDDSEELIDEENPAGNSNNENTTDGTNLNKKSQKSQKKVKNISKRSKKFLQ